MSVCLYYQGRWVKGFRWALVGPDEDGRIKLPPSKINLFERPGIPGSAPLYHQTRRARYAYSGSERYTTNYDHLTINGYWDNWYKIAHVARDTWKKVVMIRGYSLLRIVYYYSQGGVMYQETWETTNRDSREEAMSILDSEFNLESKVNRIFKFTKDCETHILEDSWYDFDGPEKVEVSVLRSGDVSRKYYGFWEGAAEQGMVIPPPDLQLALSEASEDLASNLPQTPINLAEALLDLVSVGNISSMFHVTSNVAGMLADSWLKWRYVYTTTKLDIQSMQSFLKRGLSLFDNVHGSDLKCQGTSQYKDIACRCTTHIPLIDMKEQLRRASQSLHSYDLWDLVPWSFVVDWFIPIGSMLQDLEYQSNLLKLNHGTIWYTCEWYEDSASENFMRFCTNHFVTTPCSIFLQRDPSNKTIAMRCIDAMALLIGR